MLYSQLKAKPVFSLDGAYLGRVTGAFFETDGAECDAIAAERGFFSPDDVYAVKDAVTLKLGAENFPLPSADTHMFLTTDMDVYDCKGEHIGKITDFYVEPHNKKEDVFLTESERFPFRKLVFTADNFVVLNRGDQLPRKKRAAKPKPDAAPVVAPTTAPLYAAKPTDEVLAPASSRTVDFQNYGEFRFLIGRTLQKSLTDLNHNVVFPIGALVTNDVVEEAKKRGKLAELMKYSK